MKLFLSLPITSRTLQDCTLDPDYKAIIQKLIEDLRNHGHDVFCVLERLDWKMSSNEPPDVLFGAGLDGITPSDKMIVLLDQVISPGVQIELGYAYAKNIPIEAYQIGKPAWSNMAFLRLANSPLHTVDTPEAFAAQALRNNA